MTTEIQKTLEAARHIVVVQADNPDADSLGSALALEHILGDLGKRVTLYCGVNIPEYLRYLQGWDRVVTDLPQQFDASIIVDASTYTLLEKLQQSGQLTWLIHKPCVVLDHHATVEKPLDFTSTQCIDTAVASTGELIFNLSFQFGWTINKSAAAFIMASILGDTQGLTNDLTTAGTYRAMGDLTELGANRTSLEELRREYSKMPAKIYAYKGSLLSRTTFESNERIACVTITQPEINEYSPLYNPAPLVHFDMLQVIGVQLAIVFKTYDDGKVTAALRANHGYPVAGKLAEALGGGGHDYAAGFKITDGRSYDVIRNETLAIATDLLNSIAANT
jgi:phosphoesterase RecJ-like protein